MWDMGHDIWDYGVWDMTHMAIDPPSEIWHMTHNMWERSPLQRPKTCVNKPSCIGIYVTYMIELCPVCECFTSHIWMRHVMSRVWTSRFLYAGVKSHKKESSPNIPTRHVPRVNESCPPYEWVPHMFWQAYPVAARLCDHMNKSCSVCILHVTCVDASCPTCERVPYEWVPHMYSQVYHVAVLLFERIKSECVMSHIPNASCPAREWVMFHVWMGPIHVSWMGPIHVSAGGPCGGAVIWTHENRIWCDSAL